jgi:hypothetical protein
MQVSNSLLVNMFIALLGTASAFGESIERFDSGYELDTHEQEIVDDIGTDEIKKGDACSMIDEGRRYKGEIRIVNNQYHCVSGWNSPFNEPIHLVNCRYTSSSPISNGDYANCDNDK